MHVAIDYTAAVRQRAGIGRYTRGLVRGLAEVDATNRYTLLVLGEEARDELPPNFRPRRFPLPERWMNVLWHRIGLPLPADLLAGRPDLYHSPDFVLPPLARAKGVVTIHDLSFRFYPECAEPSLVRYLERAVPRSLERAELVLAVSANTCADVVSQYGVPEQRVRVLYEGVDAHFRPVTEEGPCAALRERYRLARPYLLALGTLEPRKNLALLVRAYALLREEEPEHELVICGPPGWGRDRALGTERVEGVRLLGFVPEADLPGLLSMARLFVYPSLYEGFGLPPLEAMACGCPVVASSASCLPEVLGDAALYVGPRDHVGLAGAMLTLLRDEGRRAELRSKGIARAAAFTWRKTGEELRRLYEGLLLGSLP